MMGKFVSEAFKEIHKTEWNKARPKKADIIEQIQVAYCRPARWEKAIQHLRENNNLTNTPKDIGPLMSEIGHDVLEECTNEIKDILFKWAWPQIQRGITVGREDPDLPQGVR